MSDATDIHETQSLIIQESTWFNKQIMAIAQADMPNHRKLFQIKLINLFKYEWGERANFLCKRIPLYKRILHPFQYKRLLEVKNKTVFDIFNFCSSVVKLGNIVTS